MNTHDVLAYAVATEAVRRVRAGTPPWNTVFSADAYITASRTWPVPDFVLVDSGNNLTVGVEFKPPQQSKREYLTGLGQAIAYARDFHFGLLALPTVADDGYPIAEHIRTVMTQQSLASAPVGILVYDAATLSPQNPSFQELLFFGERLTPPSALAALDKSFYAKWREQSPEEMFRFLALCYDEMRDPSAANGTVRDRAFQRLWDEIQQGKLHHWAGGIRHYSNTNTLRTAVGKNYRNFLFHVRWVEAGGILTKEGLEALHVGTLYGAESRPFLDLIAKAVLIAGKHLILFNAISEFQDRLVTVPEEPEWLFQLETHLENEGLLKRNPNRTVGASRQFLKAEKQLWRRLELIVPRSNRVFHPNRGFIFNWSRIAALLQDT